MPLTVCFHATVFPSIIISAMTFMERISALPLFLQVILAVIVVGIAFAILKKVVKFAIWLVILFLVILAWVRFVG